MLRPFAASACLSLAFALSACAAGSAGAGAPAAAQAAGTFPGCKAFTSQPAAQRAWEQAGRPAGSDGDKDGTVCESLSSSSSGSGEQALATNCVRTSQIVAVGLSKTKYPNILGHAQRAAQKGYPSVYVINRPGASARRDRLLAGIQTKPGYDRDEAPPAMGRATWRADVEYVPSAENRSAGSVMGIKLRRYCDGTKFRYVGY